MNRYRPIDDLMLAIHRRVSDARATRDRPMPFAQINNTQTTAAATVLDALDRLVAAGLLATMRHTRDGVTNTVYWPTGIKPVTTEELHTMTESKTARLLRLIAEHGPIDSIALTAKANAEGANIPAKNLSGLLAASVKAGTIITTRPDKHTLYAMAEPVAQASSLPPLKNAGETPALQASIAGAGHALLLARIAEIQHELSAALADQKAESDRATGMATDLADICRALDVPHAGEAVEAIDLLGRLAITKQMGTENPVNETRHEPPAGRLAILTFVDGAGGVLEYLEPYVSAHDAREIILRRINSGGAEHAILVSAIWQAEREIRYGTITAPEIATLRG